jgi:hypothetical protein
VTVLFPGHCQSCSDDCTTVPLPAKLGMGDDVFKKRVPTAAAKKVSFAPMGMGFPKTARPG